MAGAVKNCGPRKPRRIFLVSAAGVGDGDFMRRLLVLLLIPGVLLVAGCAPRWVKADMSNLERDDYECRRENTVIATHTTHTASGGLATGTSVGGYSSTYTPPTSGTVVTSQQPQLNYGMYYSCMKARGYRNATD